MRREKKEKENNHQRKQKISIPVIAIIAILVIVAVIVVVIVKKSKDKNQVPEEQPNNEIIASLPDTVYEGMQVTDIHLEYLSENKQTMATMLIKNTTEERVEQERFNAMFIDKDENVIGQIQTYISGVDPNEECSVSVIINGDLTATTQINLSKVQ